MTRDGDFELVTLANGAHAVRHRGNGEVMHPAVGPWQEARALYVAQSRLADKLQVDGPALSLWDVGLGAGTNAIAALSCAREVGGRQRRRLRLSSFEVDLAPLRLALGDAAGFPFLQPFAAAARSLMEHGHYRDAELDWELHLGDARARWPALADAPAEIVFFDPFSPASNPGLWTPAAFSALRASARTDELGCTLYTYSAATPTRVSLLLAGFFVGAGAPTGNKRETTVAATRLDLLAEPLGQRWLERWERSTSRAPHGDDWGERVQWAVRRHAQFRAK